ncbi:MAG: hypothetical protein IPO87_16845 [Flavobacteriales bacterium]|nr:hypothetical protein [Flavobacteriales bacterium]
MGTSPTVSISPAVVELCGATPATLTANVSSTAPLAAVISAMSAGSATL